MGTVQWTGNFNRKQHSSLNDPKKGRINMKNIIKSIFALISALLCLFCFACSADPAPSVSVTPSAAPTPSVSVEPTPTEPIEDDTPRLKDDSDKNVKLNAIVDIPEAAKKDELKYPDYSFVVISPDTISEVFSDYLDDPPYSSKSTGLYDYNTKDFHIELTSDDIWGGLMLSTEYRNDVANVFYDAIYFAIPQKYPEYDDEQYSREFSFESRENAVKQVRDLSEKLGIELADNEKVLSFSKERLVELEKEEIAKRGALGITPDWTDTYIICIPIIYDGIPVLDRQYNAKENVPIFNDTYIPASHIIAEITKDGLTGYYISSALTGKKGDETTAKIISLDDAISALKKEFSDKDFSSDPYVIENITFCYALHGEKLAPSYCFDYSKNTDDGNGFFLLDAVTGEVI